MEKINTPIGENIKRIKSEIKWKEEILDSHKKEPFLSENGLIISGQIDVLKEELKHNKSMRKKERDIIQEARRDGRITHNGHNHTDDSKWFTQTFKTGEDE